MGRSAMVVLTAMLIGAAGCFLAHGVDEPPTRSEPPPPPPTRTPAPPPPPEHPEHDICPTVPDEECPCGIADRYPHPDAEGRCFVCHDCPVDCEIERPEDGPLSSNARLSWQAPGGYAGWGPAVVVHGDGTVETWNEMVGFSPDGAPSEPPDETYDLGFGAVEQLFLRLLAADTRALPHEGPGAECYPVLWFRACEEGCAPIAIEYSTANQILPELACVGQWFEEVGLRSPTTYCAF